MKITREDQNTAIVFVLEGSLSVEDISTFQDVMNNCLPENKHIVLEMSEVSFIDSSSLGVIVLFYSKMLQQDKNLIIFKLFHFGMQVQYFNLISLCSQ